MARVTNEQIMQALINLTAQQTETKTIVQGLAVTQETHGKQIHSLLIANAHAAGCEEGEVRIIKDRRARKNDLWTQVGAFFTAIGGTAAVLGLYSVFFKKGD